MKCKMCLNEWNPRKALPDSLIRCKNCGSICVSTFASPHKTMAYIAHNAGFTYLTNKMGVSYLLEELCPYTNDEKKLLQQIINEGIMNKIISYIQSDHFTAEKMTKEYLRNNTQLSNASINYLIEAFSEILDWEQKDSATILAIGKEFLRMGEFSKAYTIFEKLADIGDIDGTIILGVCNEFGLGTEKNKEKAFELYKIVEKEDKKYEHFEAIAYELMYDLTSEEIQKFAILWYSRAMSHGSISAYKKLGCLYSYNVDKIKEAIELLDYAARCGDAEAANYLGMIYGYSQYGIMDLKKAYEWFEYSIKMGYLGAYCNYALLLYGQNKIQEAIALLNKASARGTLEADYILGCIYRDRQDFASALKFYEKAAMGGHAEAMSLAGAYYLMGTTGRVNVNQGMKYTREAARKGVPEAIHNLGASIERESGDIAHQISAFECYCEAAEKGYVLSQNRVAVAYLIEGKQQYISNSPEDIFMWMVDAMENNTYEQVVSLLAYMFLNGIGVEKDTDEAVSLYVIGAKKGDKFAQSTLATFLYQGKYFEQNYEKAKKWYEKAAEQGEPFALLQLGMMYAEGIYVKKDADIGMQYITQAIDIYDRTSKSNNVESMIAYSKELKKNIEKGRTYLKDLQEEKKLKKKFTLQGIFKK